MKSDKVKEEIATEIQKAIDDYLCNDLGSKGRTLRYFITDQILSLFPETLGVEDMADLIYFKRKEYTESFGNNEVAIAEHIAHAIANKIPSPVTEYKDKLFMANGLNDIHKFNPENKPCKVSMTCPTCHQDIKEKEVMGFFQYETAEKKECEHEYCQCQTWEPGKSIPVEKINPPICAKCHKEIIMGNSRAIFINPKPSTSGIELGIIELPKTASKCPEVIRDKINELVIAYNKLAKKEN